MVPAEDDYYSRVIPFIRGSVSLLQARKDMTRIGIYHVWIYSIWGVMHHLGTTVPGYIRACLEKLGDGLKVIFPNRNATISGKQADCQRTDRARPAYYVKTGQDKNGAPSYRAP